MTGLRSLTDIVSEGRTLPDGYDTWGWKMVRPDLTTRDGFRWPWPGNVAEVTDPEPGPEVCGRGLHIALKPSAMLGYGPTLLLLAYRQADVIAADANKCRVSRCLVVDVVDLPGLGRAGNLVGADLVGADLVGAYLVGAYLVGADLGGAYLVGADLGGADLGGAYLGGAYLRRSQLTGDQHAQITGTPNWVTS